MAHTLKRYIWFIPVCVVAALYWKALYFGLVWDDKNLILEYLPQYSSPVDVFKPLLMEGFAFNYYRPLVLFSWLIDRMVSGADPLWYHVTEIFLHIINVVLVYFLTRELLSKYDKASEGAVISALMFAVHPVQTEVVCWISGRPEALFTMFTLASFLFFIYYRQGHAKEWLVLSILCWFMGLLSKETAVALVPCLVLYDLLISELKRKAGWPKAYIWFAIVFVVYLFLRHRYLILSNVRLAGGAGIVGLAERLISAYCFYIQRAILPLTRTTLIMALPSLVSSFLGMAVYTCTFMLAVRSYRNGLRLSLYAWLFFMITLFPSILVAVTNVSRVPVAERYLYFPLFGLCLAVGALFTISRAEGYWRVLRWILAFTVLGLFVYRTAGRIPTWQNDLAYFSEASRQFPDQRLPYQQIGNAYKDIGDYQHAIEFYEKAISANDRKKERAGEFNNLGLMYLILKNYDLAEMYLLKGIEEAGGAGGYYNLGLLYFQKAKDMKKEARPILQKSLESLKKALKMAPNDRNIKKLLEDAEVLLLEKQLNSGAK